jgi:alpha-beta hydrolase superfamily lysophospholipase
VTSAVVRSDPDEATVLTRDGVPLFCRSWRPRSSRALVLIVHGLAEHSGRYVHVGRALSAAGFACYAFDQRAHGRSPGRRVHVASFERFLWDLEAVEALGRERHPGLPIVLLGHSQGGLVALLYVLRHPEGLAAVVATSPFLGFRPDARPSRARERLLKLVSALAPGLLFSTRLDPSTVSRDPAVVDAYARDPLVSRRVSARWFTSIVEAMAEVHARAPTLQVPTLLLAAGDDRVVDAEATRRFVDRAPAERLTCMEWPGLFHEVLNEPERAIVLERIVRWLDERLDARV